MKHNLFMSLCLIKPLHILSYCHYVHYSVSSSIPRASPSYIIYLFLIALCKYKVIVLLIIHYSANNFSTRNQAYPLCNGS